MAVQTKACSTVLLCGYYGENNLGDDALLQILLQDLPDHCQALITANDASSLLSMAPSARYVNRRSLLDVVRAVGQVNALVLGGGSLLQDSTSFKSLLYYLILIAVAHQRRLPIVLWGQGLGPLDLRISRWLVRRVLPWASVISWRDPESFEIAARWRINVPMLTAPDPVWQLPRREWQGGGAVVLCWRPTSLLDQSGWKLLILALQDLVRDIDAPIHWLAFHKKQDGPLLSQLNREGLMPASLLSRSRTLFVDSVDSAMDHFVKARLVLPMRLHALILAQLASSPTAALSYDPKVSAAAEIANLPCTHLQSLPDASQLAESWKATLDHPADCEKISSICRMASQHGQVLRETFDR
ncbi:MAG: polysaccharide pyruvyl transferase CsaB [Prochlorococcus sp.]|nr:polysaccharide pyruvyl transferase CsaB [Prochlorococcus sp.]